MLLFCSENNNKIFFSNKFQQRPALIISGQLNRDNTMKKIILALAFATVALPAFANHPVARTTIVAKSDHPVAAAAVTGDNTKHPVATADALSCNDGHCIKDDSVRR
ncbi:hypothetical protein BZP36_05350 [Raoultella terrigena]|jgi:hypothetical protein|nr:hypothetical protein BZP36_05350 [Raoultella terrigena]